MTRQLSECPIACHLIEKKFLCYSQIRVSFSQIGQAQNIRLVFIYKKSGNHIYVSNVVKLPSLSYWGSHRSISKMSSNKRIISNFTTLPGDYLALWDTGTWRGERQMLYQHAAIFRSDGAKPQSKWTEVVRGYRFRGDTICWCCLNCCIWYTNEPHTEYSTCLYGWCYLNFKMR